MKVSGTRPVSGAAPVSGAREARKRATERVSDGRQIADTASVMGVPEEELTPKVRTALMTLMEEVNRLRHELETAQRRLGQLERVADQDTLLPVFNRRAFVRELSRVMAYSERYDTPSSIIYFDINSFKQINDTYGHAAGDAALERVARVLLENVRSSDVVGRLGGDELGVIMSHADHNLANEKAEMLAREIRAITLEWDGDEIPVETAYGVYSFDKGGDAHAALEAADKAMYAHKQSTKEGG